MKLIDNLVLDLSNIQETWRSNSIYGISVTGFYLACSFVLFVILYLILRSIATNRQSFVPKYSLSLSFTICSFLAFLTTTICFILFWTRIDYDYFLYNLRELPYYLIPLVFFLILTLSFFHWFIFERRKNTIERDPSSNIELSINGELSDEKV